MYSVLYDDLLVIGISTEPSFRLGSLLVSKLHLQGIFRIARVIRSSQM